MTEKAGLRTEPAYEAGCTWVNADRDGNLHSFIATTLTRGAALSEDGNGTLGSGCGGR